MKPKSELKTPKPHVRFAEFAAMWGIKNRYPTFPQVHREICDWLEDSIESHENRVLMAYRGLGKTELICMYVAWRLMLDANDTYFIISASQGQASRNSYYIREIIKEHPLCAHLIPGKETKWQVNEFRVRGAEQQKDPSVAVGSIGTQITGMRAKNVIADDLESMNNALTEEGRGNIRRTVSEMTSIGGNHLFIGTPHSDETIYEELEYRMGYHTRKWPVWINEAARIPRAPDMPALIKRGEVVRWQDAEWIDTKKRGGTTGWFKSQYLLVPSRAYESIMDWAQVQEYDEAIAYDVDWQNNIAQGFIRDEPIRDMRAYWDPATGLRGRDKSVVMLAVSTDPGNVYIHDGLELPAIDVQKGTGFDAQIAVVLEFCRKHKLPRIYVEKNFSFTLGQELKRAADARKQKLSVIEISRSGTQNKKVFIADTLEPLCKSNRLWVSRSAMETTAIKAQLNGFPHIKHDDSIDAAAGAIKELNHLRASTSHLKAQHPHLATRSQAQPVAVTYKPTFL
jgi:hypothetical protein